ncbi:MCE family protein [Amycolatopsis sp. K13G38]|uniref:MCE family protein n=1 Tax=Amycolatopsis acididurans TaxID=2724524 RepID=A0ABX1IWI2_9PSEU|nr:MCE family protein [Amycolatopsis acididurans]NKQ51674.1 MCE family protein [Amycolatopsis acididurans]
MRRLRALAAGLACCLAVTACSVNSADLVPIPGGPGTGAGSYSVFAEFANIGNLVPHAEVKVDNVTVGTVRSVGLRGWHAWLELRLSPSAALPANATAAIGQKSLLGAQYVELSPPADPSGSLRDGDVIPLERTNRYPGTEELLSALSLWLNGGGLRQVRTITGELNAALSGNEQQARDLIGRLGTLASTVDEQKGQIIAAIGAVDGLTAKLRDNAAKLGDAIDQLGPGLRVLNEQRGELTGALDSVSRLGAVGTDVLDRSRDDLLATVRDLQPTLAGLVRAGDDVPKSLDTLGTLLFPLSAYKKAVKGDFVNLSATLDLTVQGLQDGMLAGTPLETVLNAARTALQAGDPLRTPLSPPTPEPAPTTPAPAILTPPAPSSAPAPDILGGLLGGVLGGG